MLSREKLLGLDELLEEFSSARESTSADARKRLIKTVMLIADNELTPTQKLVVTGIYADNKTLSEVAEELGVSTSAVCRTHKRAIERIRRYSRYASLRS